MTDLGWFTFLILVVGSALATAVLIVVFHPLLRRYALARPNARSSHTEPTPQGAGAPVIIVTIIASLMAASCVGMSLGMLVVVLGAAAALAIVGAIDDIKVLEAAPRLIVQLAAATTVITSLPDELRVLDPLPLIFERAVLVLAIVWFVNLVNFMDGIDWITVAELIPILGSLAVLATLGEVPPIVAIVALSLGGATLGFAPFNRPVARLFLGDVGSLPIGLVVGWLLILTAGHGHLITAILLPLYYLADATLTLVRRFARREKVWQAHRSHYYQRATARGFTVLHVVARVFAVNLGLAVCGIVAAVCGTRLVEVLCLVVGCVLVAWLLRAFSRGRV